MPDYTGLDPRFRFTMALLGYGYANNFQQARAVVPAAIANRIEYRRDSAF